RFQAFLVFMLSTEPDSSEILSLFNIDRVIDMTCAKQILVVEDDRQIRETLRQWLELEGYNVVTASDGKEALDQLAVNENICLILLDLMMPVMNGWEFLEVKDKMDKSNKIKSLPVVIVTAAGDAANVSATSISGIVRKPIDLDLLMQYIKKYCG
ncbi:MAG: response regulator, partial [Bdellovibrionota bacterium]